jgi:hypothetical protein
MRVRQGIARDGSPRLEPLRPGSEGADAGFHAVGDDERRVEREQGGQFRLVGLELVERAPEGRVLVRGVLEFDEHERQAVHEQYHVRTARVLGLAYRELVDREPVVGVGLVELKDPHLSARDGAVRAAILHRDPIHQVAMEGTVACFQGRAFGTGELAESVVQGLGGKIRVEGRERLAQAVFQQYLPIVLPLGSQLARCDVGAVLDRVAEAFEPGEGRSFDGGFGESVHISQPGNARQLTLLPRR